MSTKVKFTDGYAPREGDEVEVTDAAAKRLIDKGWAEKPGSSSKSDDGPPKAKTTAKKGAKKRS